MPTTQEQLWSIASASRGVRDRRLPGEPANLVRKGLDRRLARHEFVVEPCHREKREIPSRAKASRPIRPKACDERAAIGHITCLAFEESRETDFAQSIARRPKQRDVCRPRAKTAVEQCALNDSPPCVPTKRDPLIAPRLRQPHFCYQKNSECGYVGIGHQTPEKSGFGWSVAERECPLVS